MILERRTDIEIMPNRTKHIESQTGCRVVTNGVEIGGAWQCTSRNAGASYGSLSWPPPVRAGSTQSGAGGRTG